MVWLVRLSSAFSVVSSRVKLLVLMNFFFFGGILITALVLNYLFPPQLYADLPKQFSGTFFPDNLILSILVLFVFNLVVSSFVIVTLPGLVLFPLSAAFLVYRAFVWGALIYKLPIGIFLLALPTLILEGESYALAAMAGAIVGVSWINPEWIYPMENLQRVESLKNALRELAWLYVLIIIILLVGAVVETAIIVLIN